MKFSEFKTKLSTLQKQRNDYFMIASVNAGVSIILALVIAFNYGNSREIVVPLELGDKAWIEKSSASDNYVASVILYTVSLLLNVTPENIDFQHEQLLRHVDSSGYERLKTSLLARSARVKDQHVSTVFFPSGDVKIDSKNQVAIIQGDLKSFVGDLALPSEHIKYKIQYQIRDYLPLIKTVEEIKPVGDSHA